MIRRHHAAAVAAGLLFSQACGGGAALTPLPPTFTRGVLGKYIKLVGSASDGAVLG